MSGEQSFTGLRARIDRLIIVLNAAPLWPILTIARIAVGAVFLKSAMLKVQSWQITLLLFRDEYQLPLLPFEFAARLATMVEFGGAILLLLGLLARLATLPLLATIAVIQIFVYPSAWAEHLTWTGLLLAILLRGPGPLSIDHLFARAFATRAVRVAGT
jgi:putative oxidoreductase